MNPPSTRLPNLSLDHVAVAVSSVEESAQIYVALGGRITAPEIIAHEGVRISMIELGGSRIELLEPVGKDSVIARFLTKHGPGIHHLALRVPVIEDVWADLRTRNVRLVSDSIQVGAGGHRYFFIHPESTGGVLIEIVGEATADASTLARELSQPAVLREGSGDRS